MTLMLGGWCGPLNLSLSSDISPQGPIHEIRENGACVIGLKPLASIPLLVYDL